MMSQSRSNLLSLYETRLTAVERMVIQRSPMPFVAGAVQETAYLPPELELLRYQAHLDLPRLRGLLNRGLDVAVNPEGFGLAVKLSHFELRHGTVEGWPGFVLLMRKMLGDGILPWLPALFLAAVALPGLTPPAFDLDEVMGFGAAL